VSASSELSESGASGDGVLGGAKAQERSVPFAGSVIGDDMRSVVPAGSGDEEASTSSAGEVWSPATQAVSEVQTPWGAQ
jgi:hypothetical protein